MAGFKKKTSKKGLIVPAMIAVPVFVAIALLLFTMGQDMPVLNPQGAVGVKELDLIKFTLLLSVVVVVPVFAMLGIFAWKFREGNDKAKYTPDVDSNRWLEALWWGVPIVIIGILSVVTWVTTHDLDPQKALASNVAPLRVQVVALQWKWLFIYPDQHIASMNELKIPTGTPVNFEITADAPMSAFWIPSLGTQVYAMQGMVSKLSLIADHPGTYRGTNSNINGKGYSSMNFNAIALDSRRDFDLWAQSVINQPEQSHVNLDWAKYMELKQPSEGDLPVYYHMHDDDVYTKAVNQYLSADQKMPVEQTHEHTHDDGDAH
jgi:cytochrome o ubiquinol oxidase subunit 2